MAVEQEVPGADTGRSVGAGKTVRLSVQQSPRNIGDPVQARAVDHQREEVVEVEPPARAQGHGHRRLIVHRGIYSDRDTTATTFDDLVIRSILGATRVQGL